MRGENIEKTGWGGRKRASVACAASKVMYAGIVKSPIKVLKISRFFNVVPLWKSKIRTGGAEGIS